MEKPKKQLLSEWLGVLNAGFVDFNSCINEQERFSKMNEILRWLEENPKENFRFDLHPQNFSTKAHLN